MMLPVLSAEEAWADEQIRWRAYHARHIAERLAWAEEYVAAALREPDRLAAHCASLLTLLDQARSARLLHDRIVNLLLALDPWPVRWGCGPAWAALLRFGVNVTQASGELRRHAALLYALANCQLNSGLVGPAQDLARRALDVALAERMIETAVAALDLYVFAALRQGETTAAQKLVTKVAGAIDQADRLELPEMARLYFSYARILRRMGRLAEAVAWAERAVRRVENALPRPDAPQALSLAADAYNMRGVMYWAAARYAEAMQDLELAATHYRSTGDERAIARVHSTLGLVYWSLGELERAETLFENAINRSEELGDSWQTAMSVGNLGLVELCRGRLQSALTHFERQLTLVEKNDDPHETMRALGNRGIVHLHRGDFAAALADLQVEQEFAERSGLPEGLICNYVTQVRCLAGLGQTAAAHALAERALAMARRTGSAALIIIALRCLAEQVAADAARAALAEALNLAQKTGRQLDEAACLLALAGLMGGAEQRTTWRAGRRILQRMGASAWLKGHSPLNPPQIVLIA